MAEKMALLIMFSVVLACGQISREQVINSSHALSPTKSTSNSAADTTVGYIIPIGEMHTVRSAHTATVLMNGQVLITGGFAGSALSSAEIYDSNSKTFKLVAPMAAARSGHTATLLPDGNVLIAGGYNGNYLSGTEIFNPETQAFSAGPEMTTARSGHTATNLNKGKFLFAGGVGTGWSFLISAEIFDIQTKKFVATGSMTTARESHTATVLKDGNVLITGGHKDRRENITIYSSAERYDVSTGKFGLLASMNLIRHKHDAVRLADGSVLITGGADQRDSRGTYNSAELFHPLSSSFKRIADMKLSRYKHNGTSVALPGGNILLAGGANHAEIFHPASAKFSVVPGSMGTKRLFSAATLLPNGQVLITGGYNENQEPSAGAWLYVPKH